MLNRAVLISFLFVLFNVQNILGMQSEPKPLRIAFFIDNDFNEGFGVERRSTIAVGLAFTLEQKAVDVAIVSDYILKNMILRKYTTTPDSVMKNINFDLSDWDIYYVKDTPFFCFLRKDFVCPIFKEAEIVKVVELAKMACEESLKTKNVELLEPLLRRLNRALSVDLEKYKKEELFVGRALRKCVAANAAEKKGYIATASSELLGCNEALSALAKSLTWEMINFTKMREYMGGGKRGEGVPGFPKITWAKAAPSNAKKLLSHRLLEQISYAKSINDIVIDRESKIIKEARMFKLDQLKEIFDITVPKDRQERCNIIMFGHGWTSLGGGAVAGIGARDMADALQFFNDKLNTKSVRINTCSAGGSNLDLMQIRRGVPIRINYLLIIDAVTDAPTVTPWPNEKPFEKTEFFRAIDINGYFEAIENFQLKLNLFLTKIHEEEKNKTEAEKIAAVKLFGHIPGMPKIIIESKLKQISKESELAKMAWTAGLMTVLQKLSLFPDWYFLLQGPNNIPQVWIPEIGWFQTFNIDPQIQKITDSGIHKASLSIKNIVPGKKGFIFEPKKTAVEIKDKLAMLLYSEIVFINLEIIPSVRNFSRNDYDHKNRIWLINLYKYFPSITCLDSVCSSAQTERTFYIYPQIVSMQHGEGLNLFAKINLPSLGAPKTETGILNFLRDSFFILRDRKSIKNFFIKELSGFNDFSVVLKAGDELKKYLDGNGMNRKDLSLENVFIQTRKKEDMTLIDLYFKLGGDYWIFNFENKFDLEQVLPNSKENMLWQFRRIDKIKFDEDLGKSVAYFANLSTNDYYNQLPVVRDLFKWQDRPKGAPLKTLREFLKDLSPAQIKDAMKRGPEISKAEWKKFEQTQLKLKLKMLRGSLLTLKQKLESLRSKLQRLRVKLATGP